MGNVGFNHYSYYGPQGAFNANTNANKAVGAATAPINKQNSTDSVHIRTKKEIYIDRMQQLFPNNELQELYDSINKDFGIDRPAHLRFLESSTDKAAAGGFTFSKNEITLDMSDLLDSDTKIVGIKDGKRTVLTSPKCGLPMFCDKKNAMLLLYVQSKRGNMGFDKLVAEPVTPEDQKKFIALKIAHEVVHAQQHMKMRQTEGIGEKEILKAWSHAKPSKNLIEQKLVDIVVENCYKKSYWGNEPLTETSIKADSEEGKLAKEWLEAVRNYPPVDSPEYEKNAIEVDAYKRSAEYIKDKYGEW